MDRASDSLGNLLRSYRLRAGLSQEDLARRAKISIRTVRNLEQHRVSRPRSQSLEQLSAALQLPADDRHRLRVSAVVAPSLGPDRNLQINVLGPLEVWHRGTLVPPGTAAQQCLLGLLALQPGRTVTRDEIVEVLWGHSPPAAYVNLTQVYVRRLRRILEPDSKTRTEFRVLTRVDRGYRLDPDHVGLDLMTFDKLIEQARQALTDGSVEVAEQALAQALHCWRGRVLGEVEPRLLHHPTAVAATHRRTEAALAYSEAAHQLGLHRQAAAQLGPVAADEPLHESLHAQLMVALAAAGQQAAALQVFEAARQRLIDELGIEPGAELRRAHLRVLRQSLPERQHGDDRIRPAGGAPELTDVTQPDRKVIPAQLPPRVAAFTGRAAVLEQMDLLLTQADNEQTIAVIDGTAGVGKTALAVHWAHRVREQFPDGQLYANLRGYAPGPPSQPIEVLALFLRALGVLPEQVPQQIEEAAALYRSLLADRRMLVLLDNSHDAGQVRPLLPGGPHCRVVVTSRDRLTGLVAVDGARRLTLDVLPEQEAHQLLSRIVGAERLAAESQPAAQLAQACAFLPLALRIAAANLLERPQARILDYLSALRDDNALTALTVHGDDHVAVRSAFDLSYTRLEADARRIFRLLGLAPGPDVTAEAAAALAAFPLSQARRLLDRLADAHLVDQHVPGRYACHDLLRRYAAERLEHDDGEADRHHAAQRLYDYYLHTIDAAAQQLYPGMVRLPLPTGRTPAQPTTHPAQDAFADAAAALAWLDGERPNLMAAIGHAARHGHHQMAGLLADHLRGYFYQCMHVVDWLTAARTALSAAQADDDLRAQAAAQLSLGTYYWYQGRHHLAIDHHARALALARSSGWTDAQAAALGNLGSLYRQLGRLDDAVDHLVNSLHLNKTLGRTTGQACSTVNLGTVWADRGLLDRAEQHFRSALLLYQAAGSRGGEAVCLANLGDTHHTLGRDDVAIDELSRAWAITRDLADRSAEGELVCCLAAVHRDTGHYPEALHLAETALTISQETGDRYTEANARTTLAGVHVCLGRHEVAVEHYQRALRLARDDDYPHLQAQALIGIAAAHQPTRPADARTAIRHALTLTRALRYRVLEGQALTTCAGIEEQLGEKGQAVALATHALAIHRDTGHRLGRARTHLLLARLLSSDQPALSRNHASAARTVLADIGAADPPTRPPSLS